MNALIADDSRPSLREHIGRLLSTCTTADIAVSHIRLAALDLTEHETRSVRRCRILLARLDARALSDFGYADDYNERSMHTLRAFLESGHVAVRSAGIGAWAPDFSVYGGLAGGAGVCLVGAHYFRTPVSETGPSFTAMLTDSVSVATATARFELLWRRSHDVLEPVISAVHRRHSFSAG